MNGETYEEFVEKFKPKKTTDDCMTPPEVYEIVKDWACEEYGIDEEKIVRPFWPGGDYKNYDYPEGCVVLDNPPFSILAKIRNFYVERGIRFFLFAPGLTMLSVKSASKVTCIVIDARITYENGAKVDTGFITNLEPGVVLRTAPVLGERLKGLKARPDSGGAARYEYPENVITTAKLRPYAGITGRDFEIREEDCVWIRSLDEQKEYKTKSGHGVVLYGGGLLISDEKAKEFKGLKMLKEDNTKVWHLSEREREIVEGLGKRG